MKHVTSAFKDELLFGLKAVRESILSEALKLPTGAHNKIFLGTWTVMDLLAHLAGWDAANLQAVNAILDGLLPEFYEHHDKDWKIYNAMLVALYKRPSLKEQVEQAREMGEQVPHGPRAKEDFIVRLGGKFERFAQNRLAHGFESEEKFVFEGGGDVFHV